MTVRQEADAAGVAFSCKRRFTPGQKPWIDKQRLIRKGPLDAFDLIHDPARSDIE
jgi:hypothetical protein